MPKPNQKKFKWFWVQHCSIHPWPLFGFNAHSSVKACWYCPWVLTDWFELMQLLISIVPSIHMVYTYFRCFQMLQKTVQYEHPCPLSQSSANFIGDIPYSHIFSMINQINLPYMGLSETWIPPSIRWSSVSNQTWHFLGSPRFSQTQILYQVGWLYLFILPLLSIKSQVWLVFITRCCLNTQKLYIYMYISHYIPINISWNPYLLWAHPIKSNSESHSVIPRNTNFSHNIATISPFWSALK